jgi:hypothetical protein
MRNAPYRRSFMRGAGIIAGAAAAALLKRPAAAQASGASSMQTSPSSFIEALSADGPAFDRADKMQLYGQFVGSWEMDVKAPNPNGAPFTGKGEIHFGWALKGRAVQDVWITPPRGRPTEAAGPVLFYGTTLRVYDPGIDAWHILWSDPVRQYYTSQIGRAQGPDIVQEGSDGSGAKVRWRFTEITDRSFHWIADRAEANGDWRLVVEFFARRTA